MTLAVTPEVDASVDADGDGRHLAFGGAAGISYDLSKKLTVSTDIATFRDNDPSGHATLLTGGAAIAWQPSDRFQIDIGMNVGLTHASPNSEVYVGFVRRL